MTCKYQEPYLWVLWVPTPKGEELTLLGVDVTQEGTQFNPLLLVIVHQVPFSFPCTRAPPLLVSLGISGMCFLLACKVWWCGKMKDKLGKLFPSLAKWIWWRDWESEKREDRRVRVWFSGSCFFPSLELQLQKWGRRVWVLIKTRNYLWAWVDLGPNKRKGCIQYFHLYP